MTATPQPVNKMGTISRLDMEYLASRLDSLLAHIEALTEAVQVVDARLDAFLRSSA